MSRQKVFIVLAVLVLASGAGVTTWLLENRPEPETVIPTAPRRVVRTMRLKKQDRTFMVRGFGTVRPKTELSVVPEVSGKVIRRAPGFRTGGFVKKGALLFQIDPADHELTIARHKAEIARLRADIARLEQEEQNHRADLGIARRHLGLLTQEMDRSKRLRGQGVISSGQYEQSQQNFLRQERAVQSIQNALALLPAQFRQKRASLEASRSELSRAVLQLSRTKVRAPFDARVREASLDAGDFAGAGRSVGRIFDASALEVPVSLPMADARWVFRPAGGGAPAGFRAARVFWNQFGQRVVRRGRVSLVDAGLDPSTRALTLVVEIREPVKDQAPDHSPPVVGKFVEVEIAGVTMRDVYVVPRAALHENDEVYLLDGGRLRIAPVEVVRKERAGVVIRGGVLENARIVLSAIPDPVSGMKLYERTEASTP